MTCVQGVSFHFVFFVDPHMLMSLEDYVTIFSGKTTLKMAAECIIQFIDHVRYKDMSYQCK